MLLEKHVEIMADSDVFQSWAKRIRKQGKVRLENGMETPQGSPSSYKSGGRGGGLLDLQRAV